MNGTTEKFNGRREKMLTLRRLLKRSSHSPRQVRELASTPNLGDKHFLFVAGLHRSGTSVLHRHLREHDQISGFHDTGVPEDEGQHLQDILPTAREHGGPGVFAFDARAHMVEEDARSLLPEMRGRLLRQWGAWWDLTRPVLVEKSPPTLTRSRFFQEILPNSSFVFLVRHPIAVALATRKWSRASPPELVRHWSRAHELMMGDVSFLRRVMVVRYEDYVRSPASTLEAIYRMVGLANLAPREDVSDHNSRYFKTWEAGISQANDIRRSFADWKSIARRFGYLPDRPYVDGPPSASGASWK